MNEVKTLLECWPAVLLTAVLVGLGAGIKHLTKVDNKWIPLVLPVVGGTVMTLMEPVIPGMDKVGNPHVVYALLGALCGCVAVWGHSFVANLFLGQGTNTKPTLPTPPTPPTP